MIKNIKLKKPLNKALLGFFFLIMLAINVSAESIEDLTGYGNAYSSTYFYINATDVKAQILKYEPITANNYIAEFNHVDLPYTVGNRPRFCLSSGTTNKQAYIMQIMLDMDLIRSQNSTIEILYYIRCTTTSVGSYCQFNVSINIKPKTREFSVFNRRAGDGGWGSVYMSKYFDYSILENNSYVCISNELQNNDYLYMPMGHLAQHLVITGSNSTEKYAPWVKLDEYNLFSQIYYVSNIYTQGSFVCYIADDSDFRTYINPLVKFRYIASTSTTIRKIYFPYETLFGNEYREVPLNEIDTDIDQPYWEYTSFKIQLSSSTTVDIEDWSYDFQYIEGSSTVSKYYYNRQTIKGADLGDWGINNWMRDILVAVLNVFLFIFQFIMYLLVIAFNYLLMYILCIYLIPFIWNYLGYNMIYILALLLFYLIGFVISTMEWLWEQIQILWNEVIVPYLEWLWNDVIVPFVNYIIYDLLPPILEWIYNDLLAFLAEILILVLSVIEALLLYIFSFGTIPFNELLNTTQIFNQSLMEMVFELFSLLIEHLLDFIIYMSLYIILMCFLFIKMIYVKSRGYINRTEQIEESLRAYVLPFNMAKTVIIAIKDFVKWW
jgi:hypothetical protein